MRNAVLRNAILREAQSVGNGICRDRRRSCCSGCGQQIVEGCGARGVDGRNDHLVEKRKENLRHFIQRLVAQATEDEHPRAVGLKDSADACAQCPCAGRVVGNVEDPASLH